MVRKTKSFSTTAAPRSLVLQDFAEVALQAGRRVLPAPRTTLVLRHREALRRLARVRVERHADAAVVVLRDLGEGGQQRGPVHVAAGEAEGIDEVRRRAPPADVEQVHLLAREQPLVPGDEVVDRL